MNITVSSEITSIIPDFHVIALSMDCVCEKSNEDVLNLIKNYENKIREEYSLEELLNIPLIKESRDAYKKFGKDPSRYRLAVESLYRRIIKGNDLYIINNCVDIGNILSIDCQRSVAVLDYDKVDGDVYIRLGKEDDIYYGIGRGLINVSNIPVYVDNISPFGSTTSDTERTCITDNTKKLLIFIICFGSSNHERDKNKAIELFTKYCSCTNICEIEINKE